jgi:hypothetical protein
MWRKSQKHSTPLIARQSELIDDLPLVDLEHAKAAALNSFR